ncbi:MAG: hypothetical protein WAM18_09680 [Halobacillus sp.]|uniref:hypothetical protein n=1 Tax=Halobacillus sp. TaxID=56800 RepID=UPI003BB1F975
MVNRIYTGISFLFLAAFLFAALFICAAIGGIGSDTWGREEFLRYMFVYTPSGLLIGGIVALLAGISLFVWELRVYTNKRES